ncbi:MAG: hypothetical protein KAT69_09150 [Candidatus Aminicenantes bacterium]|nr:hypothetical protein [Candidatus Aminicenantes bacterium]
MNIKKLTQPKNTNLCGQTIIAMLGNISIKEAIKIMGTGGLTKTKHLLDALENLGLKVGSDKLLRISEGWIKPEICVLHIGFGNHWKKHWTLWNGYEDCFYDPAIEAKIIEPFYEDGGAKKLSYLEIKENK